MTVISLAQISIKAAEPKDNLLKTELYIEEAKSRGSDLILFPEMWTSGFNTHYLQTHHHAHLETIEIILAFAKKYSIWICGSLPTINEYGLITNTCILFSPSGTQAALYRKIHLFSPVLEEQLMSAGEHLTFFDGPWGRCGFAICYDLRFPELFRSYALQGAKIVFLLAAFPHPRLEHWKTLIRARAIENQMYLACVNRVGTEVFQAGAQMFFGNSMIVDPSGEIIIAGGSTQELLLTAKIDLSLVDIIRDQLQVFKDRKPHIYQL